MPAERPSMRKMREVLRPKWALGLSARQVARVDTTCAACSRPIPDVYCGNNCTSGGLA